MLWLPPGSAKSTYASVLFPAWLMSRRENFSIIGASHTADLAEAFSKRVQALVREHSDLLGYNLLNEAAHLWLTSNFGQYRSAGVGGVITGFRADCVTGDTLVTTLDGSVPIKDIEISTKPCYVLSYEKDTNSSVFRRVVAVARRKTKETWRIRTASGRVVQATGEHPFYTRRGWRKASSLVLGDVLLRAVPDAGRTSSGRSGEASGTTVVLQQNVFDAGYERSQGLTGSTLCLLQGFAGTVPTDSQDVFRGMSRGGNEHRAKGADNTAAPSPMRELRSGVHSTQSQRQGAVLQQAVCEQGAFFENEGRIKSRVAARAWSRQGEPKGILQSKTDCLAAGWDEVCCLSDDGRYTGSSYQYDTNGQSNRKFSDTLQDASSKVARGGSFDTEGDAISLVERVRGECDVYDIQVEGTECFFANGILVHNCAIIDDPVKSRADAESPTYREKAYNWYKADLLTRLKPGGAVIIIQTRWHPDDLSGRLIQDDPEGWDIVKLPAIAEADDPLGREPGDPLWSDDAYGYADMLSKIRKQVGERDWFSLYQQSPRPLEGSIFKTGQISIAEGIPAGTTFVRAWDLASTAETGGRDPDWTVGALIGRTPDGRPLIADLVRLRGGPDEVEATILATASRDGKRVEISLPQDPGQAGVSQIKYFTRRLMGYRVHTSRETGDKATRAMPLASQVNVGNVSMLRADWNRALIEEMATFPGGTHDDMVDALSRAFDRISGAGSALERARALVQ